MSDDLHVFLPPLPEGQERAASKALSPARPHVRPPPPPHERRDFLTPDDLLFETRHLEPADVDASSWRLQVAGLVERPYAISMDGLRSLPASTVTAFHECWGPPLRPRTTNLLRAGNVRWTGVPLGTLLGHAKPLPAARFVWSDGLDSGTFLDKRIDGYRKDLPLAKALSDEVLVAYAMNGEPLGAMRGGPVRLVVPGWFGTNSTKWLCRLTVADSRADSLFTNELYNQDIRVGEQTMRAPVWEVSVNSMIVDPAEGDTVAGDLRIRGWAWAARPVRNVEISLDGGRHWRSAGLADREGFEWQGFESDVPAHEVPTGRFTVIARATDASGDTQPIEGVRNACHGVQVERSSA